MWDTIGHACSTYIELGETNWENDAVMVLRLIGLGEPRDVKGMQKEYELCVTKEEATNSCASRNKR